MTIEEFKQYFEERGGKKGVKDSDPIWTLLIKHHNNIAKTEKYYYLPNGKRKKYDILTFSCGNCRRKVYKWLIAQ